MTQILALATAVVILAFLFLGVEAGAFAGLAGLSAGVGCYMLGVDAERSRLADAEAKAADEVERRYFADRGPFGPPPLAWSPEIARLPAEEDGEAENPRFI